MIGLDNLEVGGNKMNVNFSYKTPAGKTAQLAVNSYQITLCYLMKGRNSDLVPAAE